MKTIRYYYTLAELLEEKGVSSKPFIAPQETLSEFLSVLLGEEYTLESESEELKTLWKNYLWHSFNNTNVLYHDVYTNFWGHPEDPTAADLQDDINEWCAHFIRWINETSSRYIYIIRSFEDVKEHLLDTINNESLVLYNDTPQSAGDWIQDPYTTNATKTTLKQEVATPIERLREINNKLTSIYGEWVNEFRMLTLW